MKKGQMGEKFYIKGLSEGFFDVHLTDISNVADDLIMSYEEGYTVGKARGEVKKQDDIIKWIDNRNSYIETEGYYLGLGEANYDMVDDVYITTEYLNPEDKAIFKEGLKRARKVLKRKNVTIDNYLESKRHRYVRK